MPHDIKATERGFSLMVGLINYHQRSVLFLGNATLFSCKIGI